MIQKFIFTCFCMFTLWGQAEMDPQIILKKADEIRNPSESYYMKVKVESSESDLPSVFEVYIKGSDKTFIKTLEPERDRGRNLWMLSENMWIFIPRSLNRSLRISLNQKLNGQTANGDIARTRWFQDYNATLESQNDKEWILFLKAQKKGLTYDQLRVWIAKSDFRPLKAEYLTLSGSLLKKAEFRDYQNLCGRLRPREILIEDALRAEDRSLIKIQEMEVKNISDSLFKVQ